jgi:hypothetical protein
VDYSLAFASDGKQSESRRVAALAALELRLDPKKPDDVKKMFDIAFSDSPPAVQDQAFRRIGEMPREVVIDKLYESFKTDKWKLRRAAAATALNMSTMKDLDTFMSKLPGSSGDKDVKGFAMPEAITYGAKFADLKDGDKPGNAREALKKWLAEGTPMQRTTAASFYLSHGTKADLPMLEPLEKDTSPAPVCETDADCKWACVVPKESDPKEKETRDIKTLGDYVKLCVEPSIKDREERAKEAPPEKKGAGDQGGK